MECPRDLLQASVSGLIAWKALSGVLRCHIREEGRHRSKTLTIMSHDPTQKIQEMEALVDLGKDEDQGSQAIQAQLLQLLCLRCFPTLFRFSGVAASSKASGGVCKGGRSSAAGPA